MINCRPRKLLCDNCFFIAYTFIWGQEDVIVIDNCLMQLLINLLKIVCTNIAWQRRKLGKILHDWRVIHMQVCPIHLPEFDLYNF